MATTDLGRTGKRKVTLRPRGQVYNLFSMFNQLNRVYFDGRVEDNVRITWGQRRYKPRRRYIRFGAYFFDRRLIRVNPDLDDERVPEYVVRYIVFHEMLHALQATPSRSVRTWRMHQKDFRENEKKFPQYDEATLWLKENIRMFIPAAASRR